MAKISSRKRVKVTLACIVCRKKKVKCDGVQPSCSRCQSNGVECQYTDPPKKRGPPKVRIEVIENRKHRIESLLLQQQKYNSLDYTQSFDIPVNTLLCLIAEEVQRKKINVRYHLFIDTEH
ncbi:hypothetical protein RMCBS344292_19139 [Rhizopus microsporus]|nr:hypothetical protein RMCBS344292_19139 [Rhizopus microsporus]